METLLGIVDGKVITFKKESLLQKDKICGRHNHSTNEVYLCPEHLEMVDKSGDEGLNSKWITTLVAHLVNDSSPSLDRITDFHSYCKWDLQGKEPPKTFLLLI